MGAAPVPGPMEDDRGRGCSLYSPAVRRGAEARADFPADEFRLVVRRIQRADPAWTRKHRRMLVLKALVAILAIVAAAQSWRGWTDLLRVVTWIGMAGAAWYTLAWMFPTTDLALIKRALLGSRRCPSCAYRLHGLVPEADGCTVCPECGGAWKLEPSEQPE